MLPFPALAVHDLAAACFRGLLLGCKRFLLCAKRGARGPSPASIDTDSVAR